MCRALTVLNAQGGIDLAKVLADIQAYGAHHKAADLASVLYAGFGMRGMRGAALVALQQGNFAAFEKAIAGTPGAAAQQATFAKTPLQQFEQVWARLRDIGNVLATAVLPDFLKLTEMMLALTQGLDSFFTKHPYLSKILVEGGVGALVAGPDGALVGAISGANPAGVPIQPDKNSPLYRLLHAPTGGTGDVTVTLNSPITVQGPLIGTQNELDMILNNWWGQHSPAITATIKQALAASQQRARRATLQDPGDASTVNLGLGTAGFVP